MTEQSLEAALRELDERDEAGGRVKHWLRTEACLSLLTLATMPSGQWTTEERRHVLDEQCQYCQRMLALSWRDQCPAPDLLAEYQEDSEHHPLRTALAFHLEQDHCHSCEATTAGAVAGDAAEAAWTSDSIAAGFREGFSQHSEVRARDSVTCQRLVRDYWREHGVSLWMLARSIAEGDAFPFAPALRQHLREDTGSDAGIVARSAFTLLVATAQQHAQTWSAAWTALRDRLIAWEANTARFNAFPAPKLGFSDDAEPFGERHELPDGVVVTLEEVRNSRLHVSVTRPVATQGPSTLYVTLAGEKEVRRPVIRVDLVDGGRYVGGGDFDEKQFIDRVDSLGKHWTVFVSLEPPPI